MLQYDFCLCFCRLKLQYMVSDDSGTCSVVFWDRDDVQLIKRTTKQFKFMLSEVSQFSYYYVSILTHCEISIKKCDFFYCLYFIRVTGNMISQTSWRMLLGEEPSFDCVRMIILSSFRAPALV